MRIYIHWPFCLFKCPYCDFNSHTKYKNANINKTNSSEFHELWLKAYILELDIYSLILRDKKIKSIYFGGGTPGLMDPNVVNKIINHIKNLSLDFHEDIEITLEANPTSIEALKFIEFKNSGINRISIGIQSLRENHLKFLGRQHSTIESLKALEIANDIFGENFSYDLIYGLPNQNLKEWESDLSNILNIGFKNNHISLYQLTIEKGTKFYSMYNKNEFYMPSESLEADFYDLTIDTLKKYNFHQYEISNYSKSLDSRSKHNMGYWKYEDYLGIGPGAHSRVRFFDHIEGLNLVAAFYNKNKPENWIDSILSNSVILKNFNQGTFPNQIQEFQILNQDEIFKEIILVGLRINDGLNLNQIKERFNNLNILDFIDSNSLNYLKKNKFIFLDNNILRVNNNKVLNSIIEKLI